MSSHALLMSSHVLVMSSHEHVMFTVYLGVFCYQEVLENLSFFLQQIYLLAELPAVRYFGATKRQLC